mgnify:CR=1 FL=1
MTSVARATIRTDVWDKVYTYLQTTNPISTNNIFSAWNDNLVRDNSYPIVVIEPPLISFDKFSLNGRFTSHDIKIAIEIYQNTAETIKSLTDEVTAKLLEGRETFAGDGLTNLTIEEGDYDTWRDGNKKVHRMTITVSFKTSFQS